MDFKALLYKLDKLNENTTSNDINLIIAGTEQNEAERIKKLSAAATRLNVAGLYDPVTGNYVTKLGTIEDKGTNEQTLELARLGLLPANANLGTAGVFDNEQIHQHYVQAMHDLSKQSAQRSTTQQAEIDYIKGLIDKYEKEKGSLIIKESTLSSQLIESFGYQPDLLQEYSLEQLKQDAADFGMGVASGATLGHDVDWYAWIRSKFDDISEEKARELALAAKNAAKERSPWLYDAGMVAPGVAVGGLPGLAYVGADLMYGKEEFAVPPEVSRVVNSVKSQPEVNQQTADNAKNEVAAKLNVNSEDHAEIVNQVKHTAKTQNKSDAAVLADLLGIEPEQLNETIDISTLTEDEKLRYFKYKIMILEGKLGAASALFKSFLNGVRGTAPQISGKASKAGKDGKGAKTKGSNANAGQPTPTASVIANNAGKAINIGGKVVSAVLAGIINVGGPVTKFLWNHKYISLIVALAAWGYTFNADGNLESTNGAKLPIASSDTNNTDNNTAAIQPGGQSQLSQARPVEPEDTELAAINKRIASHQQWFDQRNTSNQPSADLEMLKSEISSRLKLASSDAAPDIKKQLDDLKARWQAVIK